MMKQICTGGIIILFLFVITESEIYGQEADTTATTEEKPPTITEKVQTAKKIEGLFTMYQDTVSGSVMMIIKEDQIGREYIHFVHTLDGVVAAGHFRGAYRGSKILSVQKYFNKIQLVAENTWFYFNPDSPLSNAADANISHAILASLEIIAEDKKNKEYLVDADAVFIAETLHQIKPSPRPNPPPGPTPFTLGSLNTGKSRYVAVNNYPENTDIIVEYVYDNPAPTNYGSLGATDARAVSIKMQHSLITLPENDYQSRFDDPRVGYFMTPVDDMTNDSPTPYRDLIHRWHLKKKDPAAAVSDPIEPIVWWIENTTPYEFRDAITVGVLRWNSAFEAAGFSNALLVKVQPDDADWDAGDIRYNVLRWTSSPLPPFGGYGPSFVNPRTGQIIGADIMLEYVYYTNRVKYDELYRSSTSPLVCSAGEQIQQGILFGGAVMDVYGGDFNAKKGLIYESLMYLTLHEVGHTLGLSHNFKSSRLHSLEGIHDKERTASIGLTGSVMEYLAINVSLNREQQGEYYTTVPGPYDIWAIQFGYSLEMNDSMKKAALLNKSTQPELAFANDADDMRTPGKGIDPHAMINDMSSDAIGYSIERLQLIDNLEGEILEKYSKPDQSYHQLQDVYNILVREKRNALNTVSRYVGGVRVNGAMHGQDTEQPPFLPIALDQQQRAMSVLAEYAFAPEAFDPPDTILKYLQKQRRGFFFINDPRIHEQILGIQKGILNHLLHQNVLQRMTNSLLYGNEYSAIAMMNDLTDAIFNADLKQNINSIRRNLQIEYTHKLVEILTLGGDSGYHHDARAGAYANLIRIKKDMSAQVRVSPETKAHRSYISHIIAIALKEY